MNLTAMPLGYIGSVPGVLLAIGALALIVFIFSILPMIMGVVALRRIDQSNGVQRGRGLAIAAIVLGALGLVLVPGLLLLGMMVPMRASSFSSMPAANVRIQTPAATISVGPNGSFVNSGGSGSYGVPGVSGMGGAGGAGGTAGWGGSPGGAGSPGSVINARDVMAEAAEDQEEAARNAFNTISKAQSTTEEQIAALEVYLDTYSETIVAARARAMLAKLRAEQKAKEALTAEKALVPPPTPAPAVDESKPNEKKAPAAKGASVDETKSDF